MRRLHLFEFEDQPWLPAFLRNAMTAYLAAAYQVTGIAKLWAEQIADVLRQTGVSQVIDLGSGSCGPVPMVADALRQSGHATVHFTLTDMFPRPATAAFHRSQGIEYWPQPVDARSVPHHLRGMRTLFASFHHFNDSDAARILSDAARSGMPIAIFEGTSRTAATIASSILIPLFVLVLTPKAPGLSWQQLLFTYVIPILPLLIFWDGLVSHLRTRSAEEMLRMAQSVGAPGYEWRSGSIPVKGVPGGLPFLAGWPRPGGGPAAN